MALNLYNNESCIASAKITSAYCTEMSNALAIDFKQYLIPTSVMLTSELLSVYIAIKDINNNFSLLKVSQSDITLQSGNKVTINNQLPENLQLHNRVIFIPKQSANLCFTGVAGSVIENKRAMWLKRSDASKAYDYISLTSINYFASMYDIIEYPNISFVNGVGSNFYNLTTQHNNMAIDFNGQRIGMVNNVISANSLQVDTNFTSNGSSRAFLYSQGSLEFAIDVNGYPSTWTRHLSIPPIDTDIPYKFWFRDFMEVSDSMSVVANNSIRILGTEFLL